jgi:hypothetical protein
MSGDEPRLSLVVATQCAKKTPPLSTLSAAATGIRTVLSDPAIGACQDVAPAGWTDNVTATDIYTVTRSAIQLAGRRRATLVLAFLGHGFVGAKGDLYFMGWDSAEDQSTGATNLTMLLHEAVDEPGVNGVVAIVDTCSAGAAVREINSPSGVRRARTSCDVLMASAVDQNAWGMRMSLALAAVLRAGVRSGPALLDIGAVLDSIRARTKGSDVNHLSWDGDLYAPTRLWLARNVRRDDRRLPAPRQAAESLAANDREQLVRLMLGIPAVHDVPWLCDLISRLPGPIAEATLGPTAPGVDLLVLIQSIEAHPELDGWQHLLDLLRDSADADANQVAALAGECARLGLLAGRRRHAV